MIYLQTVPSLTPKEARSPLDLEVGSDRVGPAEPPDDSGPAGAQ
jgi:hypothetical protein